MQDIVAYVQSRLPQTSAPVGYSSLQEIVKVWALARFDRLAELDVVGNEQASARAISLLRSLLADIAYACSIGRTPSICLTPHGI